MVAVATNLYHTSLCGDEKLQVEEFTVSEQSATSPDVLEQVTPGVNVTAVLVPETQISSFCGGVSTQVVKAVLLGIEELV